MAIFDRQTERKLGGAYDSTKSDALSELQRTFLAQEKGANPNTGRSAPSTYRYDVKSLCDDQSKYMVSEPAH